MDQVPDAAATTCRNIRSRNALCNRWRRGLCSERAATTKDDGHDQRSRGAAVSPCVSAMRQAPRVGTSGRQRWARRRPRRPWAGAKSRRSASFRSGL